MISMNGLKPRLQSSLGAHEFRGELFINGDWSESIQSKRSPILNPATGKVIGSLASGTVDDVDAAVVAAKKAFETGAWSGKTHRERARVLREIARLIRQEKNHLADLESQDVGKPLTQALREVETAAVQFEHMAALIEGLEGQVRETPFAAHAYVKREPIGVIAAISPFNFPLILSTNKIAPALAMGNSVVHKPALDTSLSSLFFAEIARMAGLPAGVLNVITGPGAELGNALVTHPAVDKVSFTGSTAVGRHVAKAAAEGPKPVSLELGGNGAQIVFADADLDEVLPDIVRGFCHNAGQFCMAGPRLLVERPIKNEFVTKLEKAIKGIEVGDPSIPTTTMGPLATEKQYKSVASAVRKATEEGAVPLSGRGVPDEGYYLPPTVFTDVDDDSSIVTEEIFGPVATIQYFDDEQGAISQANSTPYGLAAGVYSRDIARIHRVTNSLQAGMVWANTWGIIDPTIPFGGTKASGYGRENGPEGLYEYSQTKSVVLGLK